MGKCTLRRKKTCLLVQDGTEELVSRAKSLHKEVSLALTDHLHSLGDGRKLVGIVNDSEDGNIHTLFPARLCDQSLVTDKSDIGQAKLHSLCCSRNGMTVNTPGSDHALSGTSAAKFGENFFKTCKHRICN